MKKSNWNALKSFGTRENKNQLECFLCPHNCKINDGHTGLCGVRKNINGELFSISYGMISSAALDPIEKKPLYMFHPGTYILSIGSFGCNLRCPFCQNCEISMEYDERLQNAEYLSPEQLVELAKRTVPDGNIGVAYTYNEPLIGYEYLYDCAKLVSEAGLKNVVVTNGYIKKEPLEKLLPYIDAMNIDLKGFSNAFYKKLGGTLEPVKETIALAHKHCHVEVTTLIIPEENENDVEEIAKWIAGIDPKIPLHLSRSFPHYQYADKKPAEKETMYKLYDIAKQYVENVFMGNMH